MIPSTGKTVNAMIDDARVSGGVTSVASHIKIRDCMVIEDDLTLDELEQMSEMEPEDERCKIGRCSHCGDIRDDLLPTEAGDLRCAECDTQFQLCSICEEEQHEDDTCRHLFYDRWHGSCEWLGSGSWRVHDAHWMARIKQGVFHLLSAVPFARQIRAGILAGEFYLFIISPLIGRPSLEVNGLRQPDGTRLFCSFDVGERVMEAMEADCDDKQYVNIAAHWLLSLYKDQTPEANAITVSWIEEYLATRTDRMLCSRNDLVCRLREIEASYLGPGTPPPPFPGPSFSEKEIRK